MNDDELEQAVRVLESYNRQLEALTDQVRLLQASRDEAVRASRSLQAIADAKPGEEVLLPVGASSFVTVVVGERKKAVVGIGSGVSVEKGLTEAKSFMDGNADSISEALKRSIAAMQEVSGYAEDLQNAIQAEYSRRKQALPMQ